MARFEEILGRIQAEDRTFVSFKKACTDNLVSLLRREHPLSYFSSCLVVKYPRKLVNNVELYLI